MRVSYIPGKRSRSFIVFQTKLESEVFTRTMSLDYEKYLFENTYPTVFGYGVYRITIYDSSTMDVLVKYKRKADIESVRAAYLGYIWRKLNIPKEDEMRLFLGDIYEKGRSVY